MFILKKLVVFLLRFIRSFVPYGNVILLLIWHYKDSVFDGLGGRNNKSGEFYKISKALNQKGYFVLDNYYTDDQCEALKREIDRLIIDYADEIQVDGTGSDHRILGAELGSPEIKSFTTDRFLQQVSDNHYRCSSKPAFTLGAKLLFQDSNLGSGGGWHRDSFSSQFKAIVYLTDVSSANGPFQYIEGSHRFSHMIRGMRLAGLQDDQKRLSQEEIDTILSTTSSENLVTFNAKKGGVILVDTSGVHRGMPIEQGERYALTNYYMRTRKITARVYKKFNLIVRAV